MNKAQQIIQKYDLHSDDYVLNSDPEMSPMMFIQKKYLPHVGEGWYGMDGLGDNLPLVWYKVLDEFLQYVKDDYPDFEIQQIKVKYGGIRIYLGKVPPHIDNECQELSEALYSHDLVY